MDLDNLIIAIFCIIDDAMKDILKGQRLRERGPEPLLADSEVMTIEAVGELLKIIQDIELYRYFKRHFLHLFPALGKIHRTTFVRQGANLRYLREKIWQHILSLIKYDPYISIVDSFPIHVCQFARASRCINFRSEAAYGKDRLIRQTFFGFRVHMLLSLPGVITSFVLAPGNEQDIRTAPELIGGKGGFVIGDRGYWSPIIKEDLKKRGIDLEAPYRRASRDPWPERSTYLNHIRHLIETVFSQLTRHFQIKQVWARDMWHLCSRLVRKALSHTLAFLLNQRLGNPPLQFARLFN